MNQAVYILEQNDPEYRDWILCKQKNLLLNCEGEIVYQYAYSEPRKYDPYGKWIHILTPVPNKNTVFSRPIHLGTSPGWRPNASQNYEKSKKLNFQELCKNQYGHIQLTDYHYNYLCDIASEFEVIGSLTAFKIEEDDTDWYTENGLKIGYYLINNQKVVVVIGEINQFSDCEHFMNAISS